MKKILIMMLICIVFIISCGKSENNSSEKTKIKIGGTVISKVTYEAIKPYYEKLGYKTEFALFDSNPVVLEACNSGEVDISIGQHKKFVESFNKTKNGNLGMAKPYGYYTGIGLYSEKYNSIEEIPNNAKIAIMNDPMNMGIALKILQDTKLIKLKENIKTPTISDIIENKKNIKIIDMEQAQTVVALKDMDAAAIFFTHMSNAGKDPSKYLERDKDMINFPLGVIVKKENLEKKWVKDFANLYKEPNVQNEINNKFPGVFEFYNDDSQVKE